jgi:antibiotic biosynthesis monooxygenase (ABM) superfamily enzyme
MSAIAKTPTPPYYAVIFTSLRTEGDDGYDAMSERMLELVARQPGYLGVESAREGVGITPSPIDVTWNLFACGRPRPSTCRRGP